MTDRRVVITGATGMVGGEALRLCLDRSDISSLTTVGRRPTGQEHPKLHEVQHADLSDFAPIASELEGQDVALFCLGAYTGAVAPEELRRVTVDGTVAFATALRERSPDAAFCFLSGQGADPSEQSRIAFARAKGAAENALASLGFPRTYFFRPGYIYPTTPRKEPTRLYAMFRALYPALRLVYPNVGISSVDLARVMVELGLQGESEREHLVLENRDIRARARHSKPAR